MKRVVVIGGGISGLAAAWAAHEEIEQRGVEARVLLLEREDTVGGKARTRVRGEWTVEAGPTGFLDDEPVLDRLAERAGLEKLPARDAATRRFVVRGGRVRALEARPLAFAQSGVLSLAGLLRLAAERWIPRRTDDGDESVLAFATRRLGREVAERLVAPMVGGVFAGDAAAISLPAAFPRMRELEREHGSLLRAMKVLRRERGSKGGPAGSAAPLCSFEGGMQSLPRALARRAPFTVRTLAPVSALVSGPAHSPWLVSVAGDDAPLPAHAVVLAGDPGSSAALLAEPAPAAARELAGLSCPGVAVVGLGYAAEALQRIPRGFGALIPRGEGLRSLGYVLDSHLFAGRSPSDALLVRVLLGGATDPCATALPPDDLADLAHADMQRLFGLREPPRFREVIRWPAAIPQYELGHLDRVERIEASLAATRSPSGGLFLAGNALHGIAFGRAAAEGWSAGIDAARSLGREAP
jgi:oxygen-dependent protoporphyrinogen oxidase